MESKAHKLEIEISNKDQLLQICGVNDNNLKYLEERLDVSLIPRGNLITILGTHKSVELAYSVVFALYDFATSGLQIEQNVLKSVIRDEKSKLNLPDNEKALKYKQKPDMIYTPLQKVFARNDSQKNYIDVLRKHALTFAVGPAGTGKTYIATAYAVEKLIRKDVSKIILTRPVVEAGENLGFLPGTLEEKIDPYLRPFFDAVNEMLGAEKVQKLMEQDIIEIAPLAYMRGRTIKNSLMLLDEAQNTTAMQMKMFLTRLGENSQMVITGDLTQTDLPRQAKSGLRDAVEKLDRIDDIAIIKFKNQDVIRHELVAKIVKAYEEKE
jgi:phosphate starvation-inducible PhoH-like protein